MPVQRPEKKHVTVAIRPGLMSEATQRDADNRWWTGLNVRFRKGWPEKVGGWADAEPGSTVTGNPRQIFDWVALDDTVWTAIGTHNHLYVYSNGAFSDITPLDDSGTLGTDPFTTTISSAEVSVADTTHNRAVGDYVVFDGAAEVGGITIDGEYVITEVTDANNYVITHTSSATSSATGGGAAVTYEYLISSGLSVATQVGGYGSGGYGEGGYGEPSDTGVTSEPRIWCFDNWGEDLIAGVRGGNVYVWDLSAGVSTRATLIANAPTGIGWLKVSDNRQLVVFGGNGDPLLIAWSDEEDYTDFTPSSTNAAGDLRLDQGGRIITAHQGRSEMVVWTDVSVHAFRPQAAPFYWGLDAVAQGMKIAGPNAGVIVEGIAYFMGSEDFHIYDGVARVLPCEIRNMVFGDINRFALPHIYVGLNSDFTEIWWCYPTADSNENDRVAVFNYVEGTWTLYAMERTCFHDSSSQFRKPYGMSTSGSLYKHESGYDDDTSELTGYLESYFAEIGEGDDFVFVDRAIPDFLEVGGTVNLTLKYRRYAQATASEKGPYALTDTTEKVDTRLRGRQVATRLDFEGLNTYFRMGNWKLRIMQDGKQ
jgi:hypothetical protein